MDESTKLRMNLMAIQKVDPYAKEILDSCPHVAFYKYISNEWQKSEIEGSFFVYARVAEPFHSIFINNRLNTNSLVEPITKPIELQSQPPFLLYRNQRQAISGFWFYCKEDCVRIHALLEKLIKKCSSSNGSQPNKLESNPQTSQQQHPVNIILSPNVSNGGNNAGSEKQEVSIFSMLSKAQAEFRNLNGPAFGPPIETQFSDIKISQSQQQQSQHLMKQQSNAMPDITSPNVVSFFAAAQQPNGVGVIESVSGVHSHGQPSNFVPSKNPIVPPVQTLDEIEKQHRVSSISPKVPEQKLLNNLLHSAAANSSNAQQPKLQGVVVASGGGVIQQQSKQPTLITPAMFQAPLCVDDKTSANIVLSSSNQRPEPLTQNQLIQALNYLLENDPEFIQKIHEAYVKSFNKKISL